MDKRKNKTTVEVEIVKYDDRMYYVYRIDIQYFVLF